MKNQDFVYLYFLRGRKSNTRPTLTKALGACSFSIESHYACHRFSEDIDLILDWQLIKRLFTPAAGSHPAIPGTTMICGAWRRARS